jgi:hypothetical protein
MPSPRELLAANRRDAMNLVTKMGAQRLRHVMGKAELELVQRLADVKVPGNTFTRTSMQATLRQIQATMESVKTGVKTTVVDGSKTAAEHAAQGTIDYLTNADRAFRGVGTQPLALDEASMFEQSVVGARSSVLRRLGSSGEDVPGAPVDVSGAKMGILERYGMNVIGSFEQQLQVGVLAGKSWEEMKGDIIGSSPFLQGKPSFWAERIVRTEMMGAYNRAGWEANREADNQLGDMCKILSATFDDRTAADSYAVHGQIRLPDEAFESWFGLYQHPPNRPNDREIVVPHRISWVIPQYLKWLDEGAVFKRWMFEGRKDKPPPRPNMSTVDMDRFGSAPPSRKRSEARDPRPDIPPEEGPDV